jgi:hypothetical protein
VGEVVQQGPRPQQDETLLPSQQRAQVS